MTTDIAALKRHLTDAGLTHGPLHDALDRGAAAEAKLAEWQASQHYSYIGRDGKTVLARALEDRAEAAEADRDRLAGELAEAQARVAGLQQQINEATDPDFIWGAMDNVNDMDADIDEFAKAASRAIRAALYHIKRGKTNG